MKKKLAVLILISCLVFFFIVVKSNVLLLTHENKAVELAKSSGFAPLYYLLTAV